MNLDEVEVGSKHRCDPGDGKQCYALVLEKDDWQVRGALGDAVNEEEVPGSAINRLGALGRIWVKPNSLHEL